MSWPRTRVAGHFLAHAALHSPLSIQNLIDDEHISSCMLGSPDHSSRRPSALYHSLSVLCWFQQVRPVPGVSRVLLLRHLHPHLLHCRADAARREGRICKNGPTIRLEPLTGRWCEGGRWFSRLIGELRNVSRRSSKGSVKP